MTDVPDIWLYVIIGLLGLAVAVLSIRFMFRFDFNKRSQQQYERRTEQITKLCTHTDLRLLGNNRVNYQSRMTKPPMTIVWGCYSCGFGTTDPDLGARTAAYWATTSQRLGPKRKEKGQNIEKTGLDLRPSGPARPSLTGVTKMRQRDPCTYELETD